MTLDAAIRAALLHGVVLTDPVVVGAEWPQLVAAAEKERILGLLEAAASAGTISLPANATDALAELQREAMMFALRVDSVAGEVARAMQHRGLDWRALKGVATAKLLYADSGERQIGDLDILVRSAEFEMAIDAVRDLGATLAAAPPHGARTLAAAKGRTLLHPRDVEIDVHRRVEASHRRTALSEAFLFSSPSHIEIAGAEVRTLSPVANFVHGCLHLACGGTRLPTMADLLRMLHRPDHDIRDVLIAARDEGVAGYVDWALERMAALAPLPKNVVEARRAQPVRRDERWQASFYESHPRAAFLRDLVSGPRPHLRLIELVWPSQSFLDHMGRTHAQHLLRLGTPFRWQFEEEP